MLPEAQAEAQNRNAQNAVLIYLNTRLWPGLQVVGTWY